MASASPAVTAVTAEAPPRGRPAPPGAALGAAPRPAPAQATGTRRPPLLRLFEPVDIASLVHFRMAFGAVMLWEVWRYFSNGWIGRYYVEPTFHFSYFGFDWLRPWPGSGMYLHFLALGALAGAIALGFHYRLAAALFCVGFAYVFLLDQAQYLNHLYLVCLLSLLLVFVSPHRAASIDAWRRPRLRSDTVPTWNLWLLRAQVGIVYVYGGVAKLNEDWLRGEPLRTWFTTHGYAEWGLVGPLFAAEWTAYLFSYGGLLFDLLLVPLLLFGPTRIFAFAAACLFNVTNAVLFFAPDWPRRLALAAPADEDSARRTDATDHQPSAASAAVGLRPAQRVTLGLLGAYLAVQLLVPLRHHLYPGEVSWTEEGHLFSWHMKLRDKDATVRFFATDPTTNRTWEVAPEAYLTPRQAQKMASRPDMIQQFSRHLAHELRAPNQGPVEIRVQAAAALNGRPPQWLIDPTVDLAARSRSLLPADWIVPLGGPAPEPSAPSPAPPPTSP